MLCLEMTILFWKHMQKWGGVGTVSYAVTLANHNSGRLLRSLKEHAP